MRFLSYFVSLILGGVMLFPAAFSAQAEEKALRQPVAALKPVTEKFFGQSVTDPYRWMEDLTAPAVLDWAKAQNAYTRAYLDRLPDRASLVQRIGELDNGSTRVTEMCHRGDRYFYLKITAADQTPKLYVRDGLTAPERLLVDPQKLGGTGQRFTISNFYPSNDGKLVAVEIAAGGSEEGTLRIIDAATAKPYPDTIDRVWDATVSWSSDRKFFCFTRLQKLGNGKTKNDKELDSASYLHRLGDDPEKDVVVLSRKTHPHMGLVPTDIPFVYLAPGSSYAIGVILHGVLNEVTFFVSPIEAIKQGQPNWTKFVDVADAITWGTVKGNEIWLLSHKDAPHFKVLHLDLAHPDLATADTMIPNGKRIITKISSARDALYVQTSLGGLSEVDRVKYGQQAMVALPVPFAGAINSLDSDPTRNGVPFRLTAWTEPPQWFAYDPDADKVTNTELEPRSPADFSGMTSVEVTAPASNGTLVPLSIVYKKDLARDGKNPCLLEGYGSYGISIEPSFDPTRLALLEKGIVIAYAHPRGGGENGEDWHLAGQKLTKQNTIGDFIACAEYLIQNKYTSASRLAGRGTSAGGITIGGALTQRPELFTLAICNVGVMNALRSETSPNGPSNIPEFGTVQDEAGFKGLYAMDATQHIKAGTPYPAVLLITGLNDPRVDSWELFKMTAHLQAATSSKNPILLRVDYDAGHGMGSSKTQRDLISADQAALLLERCRSADASAPLPPKHT